MAAANTSDYFYSVAVREAITRLAEANGVQGFEPGWEPPRYTGNTPDRGGAMFAANVVMAAVACAVVGGRIYARAFVVGALGGDDYAIVGALIAMTVSAIVSCWGVKEAGFGRHLFDLGASEILPLLKIVYVLPLVYTLCIFSIRLSILLFYRRLFGPNRNLQRIVSAFVWYEVISTIAVMLVFIFICNPVSSFWNVFRRADDCPTFRRTMGIYVGVRSPGVLEDVLVLLLPMKFVRDLRLPVGERVGLGLIFGLGALACVTAILRLSHLPHLLLQIDTSWNMAPVSVLDRAEQCLGIITASIPALTALIPHRFPDSPAAAAIAGPAFELTPSSDAPDPAHGGGAAFDFLRYAYDPDGTNMVYATAYAAKPRGRFKYGRGTRVGGNGSPDRSSRWLEPGTIAKTTTVEIRVNWR